MIIKNTFYCSLLFSNICFIRCIIFIQSKYTNSFVTAVKYVQRHIYIFFNILLPTFMTNLHFSMTSHNKDQDPYRCAVKFKVKSGPENLDILVAFSL